MTMTKMTNMLPLIIYKIFWKKVLTEDIALILFSSF